MHLSSFIVALSLCLVGCSQVKTPVGKTCVSCRPYTVRGSTYHPQLHYEYEEVGLASWYGARDGFHGKPKATGEIFHHMSMTAAHKTLPIPSVVKVTNLRNGKSIVVVVDDRGPFVYNGRIIDLSYGAAKTLDLHRYKPSNVKVQTLVTDSLKLSNYIASYCKNRKDPFGRSWAQIYFQEIAGFGGHMYHTKDSFEKNAEESLPKKIKSAPNYQKVSSSQSTDKGNFLRIPVSSDSQKKSKKNENRSLVWQTSANNGADFRKRQQKNSRKEQ